jgi:uncharacterized Zn finger protein
MPTPRPSSTSPTSPSSSPSPSASSPLPTLPQPSLAQRTAHHFPTHALLAGFQLLAQDRVALSDVAPTKADATVRSKRARTVRIRSDGRALEVACTCWPSSVDLGACKHVWAALLAIDRRGGFDLGGSSPLHLTAMAEAPPAAEKRRLAEAKREKRAAPKKAAKKQAARARVKRPSARPRARP